MHEFVAAEDVTIEDRARPVPAKSFGFERDTLFRVAVIDPSTPSLELDDKLRDRRWEFEGRDGCCNEILEPGLVVLHAWHATLEHRSHLLPAPAVRRTHTVDDFDEVVEVKEPASQRVVGHTPELSDREARGKAVDRQSRVGHRNAVDRCGVAPVEDSRAMHPRPGDERPTLVRCRDLEGRGTTQ